MRKIILFLILIMAMLFTTACSENTEDVPLDTSSANNKEIQINDPKSQESASTTQSEEPSSTAQPEDATSKAQEETLATQESEREWEVMINITVDNKTFSATLENNKTANAFAAMLPIKIDMEDINGNEKYNVLTDTIRKEAAENPGTIHAGDIMCYGDAGLVLFYETFPTSYSYVPIGHIDDIEGFTEVLGNGDIQVTFSAQ